MKERNKEGEREIYREKVRQKNNSMAKIKENNFLKERRISSIFTIRLCTTASYSYDLHR